MEKERFFVFPNISPTMAIIESLGFKLAEDDYGQFIYTKVIGDRTCRLGLFHETASWDISDNTWLEFRYDDTKFARTVHSSLSFPDRFQMGTHKVPTADQIKAAIVAVFDREKTKAKDALTAAYWAFDAVRGLDWPELEETKHEPESSRHLGYVQGSYQGRYSNRPR